jgi:hypothetical protein
MSRIKNENEIRQSLAVYEAAWESRDHDAINRIHPGADMNRREVRSFREINVEIGRCSTIEIQGNQATASCPITLLKTPKSGAPQTVRYTTVDLVNQGGRWIVSRVR